MWSAEASHNGGKQGGPAATKKEYYCAICNQKMRGPVYFKHLKSKQHARTIDILHHHGHIMGNRSDQ